MKNDLLVALIGFTLSALVAWMSSITVMVFNLDKSHAIMQVREEQQKDTILKHKHEGMNAL